MCSTDEKHYFWFNDIAVHSFDQLGLRMILRMAYTSWDLVM